MKGLLCLLIASIAVAGCTKPAPDGGVAQNGTLTSYETPSGPVKPLCAQLLLSMAAQEAVLGRSEPLHVTVSNCGGQAIEMTGGGRCGGGPEIFIRAGVATYDLYVEGPDGRPINQSSFMVSFGPCPIVDHAQDLRPGMTRSFNYTWNGTLIDQACETTQYNSSTSDISSQVTCHEVGHLTDPGNYAIQAQLAASDGYTRYEWTATQWLIWHANESSCVHCALNATTH